MRIIPWQDTPQAIAILASCAIEPPAKLRHVKQFYLTSDEWLAYDESDERVAKLSAIQNEHFLAAERLGGREAARIAVGLSVDEAIDIAVAVNAGRGIAA